MNTRRNASPSRMYPACAIAEYASNRRTLVCASAAKFPTHHRRQRQHDQDLRPRYSEVVINRRLLRMKSRRNRNMTVQSIEYVPGRRADPDQQCKTRNLRDRRDKRRRRSRRSFIRIRRPQVERHRRHLESQPRRNHHQRHVQQRRHLARMWLIQCSVASDVRLVDPESPYR